MINAVVWVVVYDLTRGGYAAGIRALMPDIDETWQQMIADSFTSLTGLIAACTSCS